MDDLAAVQKSIQESLVATTRGVARLAAEDLPFHRSLEPRLGNQIDRQNARLLDLAQRLLGSAATDTKAVRPSLKDLDDVEGNWTKVVDIVDSLLERADTALDEFTGAVKRLTPRETTPAAKGLTTKGRLTAAFRNQDIEKPQLRFERQVDNNPQLPFKPLLTAKPHSKIPLQTQPQPLEDDEPPAFDQPYRHEIEQYIYPEFVHRRLEPIMYHDFDTTQATFVDTEEALDTMLQELKQAKEIAVDLEHHDSRTYIGVVSLMQISTRDKDWIVDTLVPWRHKLSCLNEVFTDPSILKVLHGAYMDIIWLQRDLGIYVVGLFDTYAAARSLGYPQCSYAALLKKFTDVDAQKQFQMADWRIRPLPQELLDYARSDTHYLLYVYDNMRNELIERSKTASYVDPYNYEKERVLDVLRRSKETALQRYEHPTYDLETGQGPAGWFKILVRTPAMFSKEQFAVFKAVHKWRDDVAREQDDSPHYVLQNHFIFTIAKEMPTTKAELMSIVQPATSTLKARGDELVLKIVKAKAEGVDGPDMIEILKQFDTRREKPTSDSVATQLSKPATSDVPPKTGLASLSTLRTIKSLFWGSAINNADQRRSYTISAPIVHMAVPMPALGANIFAEYSPAPVLAMVESPQVTTPTPAQHDEDVFTLKDLNRKRKLVPIEADDGMKDQLDQVMLPDEEADRLLEKAERKRARKEAKRAARAAATDELDIDEEPFDYASAPSMLTPAARGKEDKKKPKRSFNPYGKSADVPKGLPRIQKETAGRSMTYAR